MKISYELDLSLWEDELKLMGEIAEEFKKLSKYNPKDESIRNLRERINKMLKDELRSIKYDD